MGASARTRLSASLLDSGFKVEHSKLAAGNPNSDQI
jgi:hypothetical protein